MKHMCGAHDVLHLRRNCYRHPKHPNERVWVSRWVSGESAGWGVDFSLVHHGSFVRGVAGVCRSRWVRGPCLPSVVGSEEFHQRCPFPDPLTQLTLAGVVVIHFCSTRRIRGESKRSRSKISTQRRETRDTGHLGSPLWAPEVRVPLLHLREPSELKKR